MHNIRNIKAFVIIAVPFTVHFVVNPLYFSTILFYNECTFTKETAHDNYSANISGNADFYYSDYILVHVFKNAGGFHAALEFRADCLLLQCSVPDSV